MKKFYIFFLCFFIIKNETIKPVSFLNLIHESEDFNKNVCAFPTQSNRIKAIANTEELQKKVVQQAKDVQVIADSNIQQLIEDFLEYKQKYGSKIERDFYKKMSALNFCKRLIEKRPLVFYTDNDIYTLPGNKRGQGCFENIGTACESKPLVLHDYLSYDEMEIAALLGVFVPTFFINNGNRNNRGILDITDNFQKEGVYVGLVGARFEKSNLMEWKNILITAEQNTKENGYGLKKGQISFWEKFYNEKFPTFQEVKNIVSSKLDNHILNSPYIKINSNMYFNASVYKKRLKVVIKPFLDMANNFAEKHNKKAYCRVVGLGLGVWKISDIQEQLMIEVYEEILREEKYLNISDIEFLYFKNNQFNVSKETTISINFSKANPADKLIGKNKDKLLIAMYAWDGNAYPGNEYWDKNLTGSGDPAAACCSTIAELQNPLINPMVLQSCENLIIND